MHLINCLEVVRHWMKRNKLKLNPSKTKLLLVQKPSNRLPAIMHGETHPTKEQLGCPPKLTASMPAAALLEV